jgi:hypothetical protein
LAQAQITPGGASASSVAVAAAYVAQMGGSSSQMSVGVTISSPDAVQQIADAVSELNSHPIYAQYDLHPPDDNGALSIDSPITVTAADAVNIAISNGAVSATAMQGAAFPNGLPSLASIQQEYNLMRSEPFDNTLEPWGDTFDGSFTLVQLPPNANGGGDGTFNVDTFESDGQWWALVLPQDTVNVAVSDTQTKG